MKDTLDLPGLNIIPLSDMIEIPVYSSLIPRLPLKYQNDIIGFNHIQKDKCHDCECLGFLIQDNSMDKERIFINSIVVARTEKNIENGTLVLVHFKNYGVTVRRVYSTESSITFYPESNDDTFKTKCCRLNDKDYYIFGRIISVINKV